MININNKSMSPYKLAIRNTAVWLRSQTEKSKENGEAITAFQAARVLSAAFAVETKYVLQNLIEINFLENT